MFTAATLDRFTDEDLELDLRTTEQIAEEEDVHYAASRETVLGLPARPGVRR